MFAWPHQRDYIMKVAHWKIQIFFRNTKKQSYNRLAAERENLVFTLQIILCSTGAQAVQF